MMSMFFTSLKPPDIVGLSNGTIVENEVDSTCMVSTKSQSRTFSPLPYTGKWLAMANVVDEEWNQLLGELIRTVVVRAVSHDR